MKYKWGITGIGKLDNLGKQLEKILKGANQGSIETRYRYAEAAERFIRHVAIKYGMQRLQNIQDKHLQSYAKELQERGCADKYIKNELAAIRYLHRQVPQSKFELQDSRAFNKSLDLGKTGDGKADRAWTDREVKAMKSLAADNNRHDIVRVIDAIRNTGMRLDEACTLKRHQAEEALKSRALRLENTKGGRPREVPLTDKGRDFLDKAIRGVGRGGYVLTPERYWKSIHKYEASVERFFYNHRDKVQEPDRNQSAHNVEIGERAPLTAHGLRHLYAREEIDRKLEQGMDREQAIQEVAEQLGHNRATVTQIYLAGQEG